MSSLDDLFDVLDKVAEGTSGGGWKIIAEAEVNLGYCVFSSPPVTFPHKIQDDKDKARAQAEAFTYAQKSGVTIRDNDPNKIPYGIITTIYGNDRRLTHPDSGKVVDFDIDEFVNAWPSEGKVALTDEQKELMGSAKFPWNAVVDALKTAQADVFGKAKWCMLRQVPDGWRKAKGERQEDKNNPGKFYDWRIHVIEKVYANKAEAQADYESLKRGSTSDSAVAANGDDDQLSEKAREDGGWTWDSFIERKSDLESQYSEAVSGKGINGEALKAMNPVKAKQYIADNYQVEVADLELVFASEVEVPF